MAQHTEVDINNLVPQENYIMMTITGQSIPIKIISNNSTTIQFENERNEIVEHYKDFMIGSQVHFYKKVLKNISPC